jgi:hypothetical protein
LLKQDLRRDTFCRGNSWIAPTEILILCWWTRTQVRLN